MSVSTPLNSGGAVVIGAAAVKQSAEAIRGLPATGVKVASAAGDLIRMAALGMAGAALCVGALRRGGRGRVLSAGTELDHPTGA